MTILAQTATSVNAARFIAQAERRQRYQDACREADGNILYLAPITGSRKLAQAIEQAFDDGTNGAGSYTESPRSQPERQQRLVAQVRSAKCVGERKTAMDAALMFCPHLHSDLKAVLSAFQR
jgi:hypothetical protein